MTAAPPPSTPPVEFGAVFSRAWEVWRRNWIISLPPIVAGIAIFLVIGLFIAVLIAIAGVGIFESSRAARQPPSSATAALGLAAGVGALIVTALAVVIGLWSQAGMYGMADAAWTRGTTTLGDAFAAFQARGGAVFVAWIAIFLLAVVALVLAIPTLLISVIALGFITMYIFPAVVGGGRGGFEAVQESWRLVRRFFVPSIITWLVLYAIQYGISFLMYGAIFPLEFAAFPAGSETIPHLPPIPLIAFSGLFWIVAVVALLLYAGFLATVQVGMYRTLLEQPDPEAYPRLPPQSPPPPPVPQY